MARTPNGAGMLDIRSAAILQDIQYADEPCTPGTTKYKQHRYYGSGFFKDFPDYADPRNPAHYDQTRHWITAGAAFVITMLVIGIIHTFPTLHGVVRLKYGVGDVEVVVISAATYAIMIMFGPVAAWSVQCMGQKLTCMFGLVFFFIGLMLDAIQLHIAVHYLAHLILIAIGGAFALTGAVSSVVRFFRKKIKIALTLIVIASPVGTAFLAMLLYFLSQHTTFGYTGTLLAVGFLVLISVTLTHFLPTSTRPPRHPNPFYYPQKKREIKDCITNSTKTSEIRKDPCTGDVEKQVEEDLHKSCLCICICDISILTDLQFMLWASVTCAAMISIYIPYLFLYYYAVVDLGLESFDAVCLLLWFCVASLAARVAIQMDDDHTFLFNRTLFQIAIIASGILYIFLSHAETYGWLLVWCMVMGGIEGIFVGVIPRVTLSTIPRKHMVSSWTYMVILHGIALFIGSYLIIAIRQTTGGDISFACITIGIIQISSGVLAFLLPNEEDFVAEHEQEMLDQKNGNNSNGAKTDNNFGSKENFDYCGGPATGTLDDGLLLPPISKYPSYIPRTHPMLLVSNTYCCGVGTDTDYCNNCPICKKAGPTIGCLDE